MIRLPFCVLCLICVATIGFAQKFDEEPGVTASKFSIQGATLIYNSDNVTGDAYPEIDGPDVDELHRHLRQNSNISTLQLSSSGGLVWAGDEMARIVMDFGLNTRVEGECSSSCVTIFLAGETREMTRGSRIGFHQNSWSESGMLSYFKQWREEENWNTPFDFSSWVYQDAQHETAEQLGFMMLRGVDPLFAVETKKHRPIMWFPTRFELEKAGVLRD